MKKLIMSCMVMCVLLCGCGSNDTPASNDSKDQLHVGKWYVGLYYSDSDENTENFDIEVWADVYENGTYSLRWVEPQDNEDTTETYEYELVQSREELAEEFCHIYYSTIDDQLLIDIDGVIIAMNRLG